jgi:hypothetical protein
MTLDEQIAFLQTLACEQLSDAQEGELYNLGNPIQQDWSASLRKNAATLLTIENTLRAIRDPDPAIGCVAGLASEL